MNRVNISQEMKRYPVFSYNSYKHEDKMDQSELFKDEQIKKCSVKNCTRFQKNQTIVRIYDRININNANDPLYPKQAHLKNKHCSLITSARQSKNRLEEGGCEEDDKNRTITRFVGELTRSNSRSNEMYGTQKLSLLKRIINHYSIKNEEKKYYSNIIKNMGIKIETINSSEIAIKKNLHRREKVRPSTNAKQPTEESENVEMQFEKQKNHLETINNQQFIEENQQEIKTPRKFPRFSNKKEYLNNRESDPYEKMKRSFENSQKLIQKPLKLRSTENTIESKINKYRQFLFLINMSNNLYCDLDVEKYEEPFKYYVGKGNNGNLIKSVMKKRFWFEEVADINEAHFVWTQLKVDSIFEKQSSGLKNESLQSDLILKADETAAIIQPLIQSQVKNEKQKKSIRKNLLIVKSKKSNAIVTRLSRFKEASKTKDSEPIDPYLKIITEADMKNYRKILEGIFYKKYPSFSDKIKASKQNLSLESTNRLTHNHLLLNGLIGNKKAMYLCLKEYCRLSNKKISEYVPLTFHIKNGLLDEQYRAMSNNFADRKRQKLPNYWVLKPGQFSNRGQGITCTNKLQDIRQRIIKCKSSHCKSGEKSSLIVQLYISNPLLYNCRKFDIRAFMMVTIRNGNFKGYWYQEGYVRTSSFVWSLQEIDDKYIHLTNDAIQKTCEQYGLYEPGNKITYTELQRYLYTLPKYGRNLNFFEVVYPQMRSIATEVIRSSFLNLDPQRLRDNFEIFGLDFMIDDNFRPWLIEVNTNPCLQLSCPILQRIIPHMIENAFRISIDPMFPPPSSSISPEYKHVIPENALYYNKFELIFDEQQDGESLRNLYKDSKILELIDSFEQDQELFQQEGDMLEINDQ